MVDDLVPLIDGDRIMKSLEAPRDASAVFLAMHDLVPSDVLVSGGDSLRGASRQIRQPTTCGPAWPSALNDAPLGGFSMAFPVSHGPFWRSRKSAGNQVQTTAMSALQYERSLFDPEKKIGPISGRPRTTGNP